MPVEKRMKLSSSSKRPGFIPRSILKTLGKLQQAFDPSAESKLIEEFRASQYRTVTSIRYLLILIIVPLLVNHLSKTFLINPLVEKLWIPENLGSFLNFSQEERALAELKKFEQKIKFESLRSQAPERLELLEDGVVLVYQLHVSSLGKLIPHVELWRRM